MALIIGKKGNAVSTSIEKQSFWYVFEENLNQEIYSFLKL